MSINHLISASSLTRSELFSYVHEAEQMRLLVESERLDPHYRSNALHMRYPEKTLITMFYEPSTRTNCSFQAAAIKLGCSIITLAENASSIRKGESLEDTIQTLHHYGDAIVLRHPAIGSAERAAEVSKVPIINGGDGNGEHPTQALLDIYTIYSEITRLYSASINIFTYRTLYSNPEPITITFVGDLKNSRTVHSLVRLLTLCWNLKFIYVSPASLEMPEELVNYVASFDIFEQDKMPSIRDAIQTTDVLYMTRIQRERFANEEAYQSVMREAELYTLTPELMTMAKEKMIVMHPLPRLSELPPEIDRDERAVYFKQVENGMYMRMAILDKLFRTY